MRLLRYALASLFAFIPLSGACSPDAVEIQWTVELDDKVRLAKLSAQELKMRIPMKYVKRLGGDNDGESRRLSHVNNRGIQVVDLEVPMSELITAANVDSIGAATAGILNSKKKPRPLFLMMQANFKFGESGSIREFERYQVTKRMAYRLPDLFGLERYARMTCTRQSTKEPPSEGPLSDPPPGCRELDGEVSMIGELDGQSVWLRCGKSKGGCSMRTYLLNRWEYTAIFDGAYLSVWREMKKASESFLKGFITIQ